MLVGNIACILGIPPTLRLLFCLPISNVSLKDQKKKKKLLPTLPFFPSKIIVSYSLCFLPFCSSLFFISQSLQHGYQFAFYFLCANPQSFFLFSYMQTLFFRRAIHILPWKFNSSFPELTSASVHSLADYSQIISAAL